MTNPPTTPPKAPRAKPAFGAPNADVPSTDLEPITAFEFELVGFNGGQSTELSSGAGTITYSAKEALTPGGAVPGCTVGDAPTEETANTLYTALPASSAQTLSQSFIASAALPMIHKREVEKPKRTRHVPPRK
jgi:hypothetical protein